MSTGLLSALLASVCIYLHSKMSRYRPGLPTMSLGYGAAGYSMPVKLAAIAEIGFEGVEVGSLTFAFGCIRTELRHLDLLWVS